MVGFGCRFKLDNLVPLPSLIPRLLARPLPLSSAGSWERPPSPNFSQLYIVGPSSGSNKGLRSASRSVIRNSWKQLVLSFQRNNEMWTKKNYEKLVEEEKVGFMGRGMGKVKFQFF